jgi:hypothetical protein
VAHTIRIIHPIMGINQRRRNHPLLSTSGNRRTPTAIDGRRTANENRPDNVSLTMPSAADARNVNRKNHQYSDLEARPSNIAYFEKQVRIDSLNVIMTLLILLGTSTQFPLKQKTPYL